LNLGDSASLQAPPGAVFSGETATDFAWAKGLVLCRSLIPLAIAMLNPEELPLSERKRLFGVTYLRALAAVAGYGASVPESDFDSVDLALSSRQGKRFGLDFQVKCTADITPYEDNFAFELKKKNYDNLRVDTVNPRLLFVVIVPEETSAWLRQNEKRMNLRRCGYWTSLRGSEALPNISSVTVRVPYTNLLTPETLQRLMTREIPL
jgi:hypothetical protein